MNTNSQTLLKNEIKSLKQTIANLERSQVANEDRQELQYKYEFIVNTSCHFMTLISKDYIYEAANKAYCKAVEKTENEIIGKTVADIWGEDIFIKDIKRHFDKCFAGNTVEKYNDMLNFPALGLRPFEVSFYPYRNKNGKITHIVVVSKDISERQKIDGEQNKLEKLESLGVLAGGIAHDFNNLLTAILGNIELSMKRIESHDKLVSQLGKAETACLRAKNLTLQLLTFSKGGNPVKKIMRFDDSISDVIQNAITGSDTKYKLSISNNISQIEADLGQINQVINNVIANADQSMPNGGITTISIKNRVLEKENSLSMKDGHYVYLKIDDEGHGISYKHLKNIYDPYFTTKQKGRGLGLSTAFSILRNHGGYIFIDSILDQGTTCHIYLPAFEKKIENPTNGSGDQFRTVGKILVMDDEAPIRELVSEVLVAAGCSVEFAINGEEAIEKYKNAFETDRSFDAIILDLTIPQGMGGLETIQAIREIDKDVKAIVSSGYSNDPVMASFKEYGFCDVIPKPYAIEDLYAVIQSILSEK